MDTTSDRWGGVLKRVFFAFITTTALSLLLVAPALAYQEDDSQPAKGCQDCHGAESGVESPTVSPTRKGPHGGYTSGTQKCDSCHSVHAASSGAPSLLPEPTIASTCFTCHDGTGAGGVYGVVKQRTGVDPAQVVDGKTRGGIHRIGWLNASGKVTVPGGAADGSSIDTTFTGESGGLTCTDCHSAHDGDTVADFIGDRMRSADDSPSAKATNRLLKQRPTSATKSVSVYGSDWCESCHKGRHSQTGAMGNHPVSDSVSAPGLNYSHVRKLSGHNTTSTTNGPLGGDNLGYVMPESETRPAPICQQCHEDARNVGDEAQFQVTTSEAFSVSVDGETPANPTFQNFPHESFVDGLLIEGPTAAEPEIEGPSDDLCLNCHDMASGD